MEDVWVAYSAYGARTSGAEARKLSLKQVSPVISCAHENWKATVM